MARSSSHWFNPTTKVYRYNYGFGINFYQPMVDYIDQKERTGRTKYPELPWTEERGLEQYNPRGLIRSYSDHDLTSIARQTEARAKTRLKDFKATTKNQFELQQSVSAATITRKVHREEKNSKKRKLLQKIDAIKAKYSDKVEQDDEMEQRIQKSMSTIKNYMRGKSAKAIEEQLITESKKNIAQAHLNDVEEMLQAQTSKTVRKHAKFMDQRLGQQLEESFITKPLNELSDDLRGFSKRSTLYYMDTRWY